MNLSASDNEHQHLIGTSESGEGEPSGEKKKKKKEKEILLNTSLLQGFCIQIPGRLSRVGKRSRAIGMRVLESW